MEKKVNKLTIEEKKIIAEKVMGTVFEDFYDFKGKLLYTSEEKAHIFLRSFNPNQDLTQFVEMIGALDGKWHIALDDNLYDGFMEYFNCDSTFQKFKWLCKHKYKVSKAVIEVVK